MTAARVDQAITFLYTRDLEATTRFYSEVLGLLLVLDQGDCRVWQVTESAFVGFCQRAGAPAGPGSNVIFTFVTDEVDIWADRLRTYGIPLEKPPALNETYGIYHCFVRDPNGYLLEIQRFLAPFP